MERSALNIVRAEQEIVDLIMEWSFRKAKVNEFVLWNMGDEEMEDKLNVKNRLSDNDADGSYEIQDVLTET